MKRIIAFLICAVMVIGMFPISVIAADLPFTDVLVTDWFYNDVKSAVEKGLVNGKTETTYCPNDFLTYAEAVKLAACMHEKYTTDAVTLKNSTSGDWYLTYVDYAMKNNIISTQYNWTANATRAGYMTIFANALPDSALPAINNVPDNTIPDVPMIHPNSAAIYKLYRAGILQGMDEKFTCNPSDNIKRSEVAAILTRMMDPTMRKTFSTVPETPDVPKITKQPADYTIKADKEEATFSVEVSGGKAPYTFSWYVHTKTDAFATSTADKTGKNSFTILVTADEVKTYPELSVYCIVTDSLGRVVKSDSAKITSNAPVAELKIAKQPANYQMKTDKEDAAFTIEITGGKAPYKFAWCTKLNKNELTLVTNESSKTSDTFTVKDATKDDTTYPIYCVVTDANGKTVKSDEVKILTPSASSELKITKQPANYQMKTEKEDATFEIEITGGKTPYKFDWRVNVGAGVETTIDSKETDKNSSSLVLTGATPDNAAFLIYCVVTDAAGKTVQSDIVKVVPPASSSTDSDLKIVTQPQGISDVEPNTEVEFLIEVSGSKTPIKYQWQYSTDRMMWWNVDKNTSATFMFKSKTSVFIHCIVTDATGKTVISNEVLYTVKASTPDPTPELKITTQPTSAECYTDEFAEFKVAVTGGKTPYSYQWEASSDGSNFWKNATGQGTITNTFSTKGNSGVYYYRCVITDANGNKVTSSVAKLTPHDRIKIVGVTGDQNATYSDMTKTFTVVAVGGIGTLKYEWYKSYDGTSWTYVSDGSSLNYSSPSTVYLKCSVTDSKTDYIESKTMKYTFKSGY